MKSEEGERAENPRAEIDSIDGELLRLLNRRAELALRVGAAKTSRDASLCDERRESEVLARLCRENPGPFDDESIYSIFQRIIDESLHLQQQKFQAGVTKTDGAFAAAGLNGRVAVLGEAGTFSEEAALALLAGRGGTVSCPTFDDLFRAIDEGRADFLLAPLENSIVGSIHRCYDLLLDDESLHIRAEVILPIAHYLVGPEAATLETIETVESHAAALGQCETFFAAHPHLRRVTADDTAGSVRRAVESGDMRRAAIGSRRAAEIYGGKVLRAHIEDHAGNFTRFALLGPRGAEGPGGKVSLVLRLRHEPGALHNALRPFVRRGVNLLKIESRPIAGRPSEFNFYFDLQAPAKESELAAALDEVRGQAANLRVLGRYPTVDLT